MSHYPKAIDDGWPEFLDDLENLPAEFAVIGVNDYLFLDGYRRVLRERERGRLRNIRTVLPVIELRLPIFGGHDKLKRLNYHVIFSDELDPDTIEGQFINAIVAKYELSPEYKGRVPWTSNPTLESLTELGALIKKTVPEDRLPEFGSDYEEGFNNLTIPLEEVKEALARPVFRKKHMTALGKTEWEALQWNAHSIADKKTVINSVDILFTAAASPEVWKRSRDRLAAENVNARLLDCSDAHWLSTSPHKDRIGNCFTWICADPTFVGLKHAISEFTSRTFIGDTPDLLSRVSSAPTKYISRLQIRKNPDSLLAERWFDVDVLLNPGLVAVIGNRGQGKSALADTLGLLGSSRNQGDASFLSDERFRDPRYNKAQEFSAILTWLSGEDASRSLNDEVGVEEPERVKYLPQNLLEKICNELPGPDTTRFERELREVIFSHVAQADRLGESTLDGLLDRLTRATDERIELLRAELHGINQRIAEFEERLAPDNRARISEELDLKRAELEAHEKTIPSPPIRAPAGGDDANLVAQIDQLRRERDDCAVRLKAQQETARASADVVARADAVAERIRNLRLQFDAFVQATAADMAALRLDVNAIVKLDLNLQSLTDVRVKALTAKEVAESQLDPTPDGTLAHELQAFDRRIGEVTVKLDEPARLYELYQARLEQWQRRRAELLGDRQTAGTLEFLQAQRDALESLPGELEEERRSRHLKTREIHSELQGLAETYRRAYGPVHDFVAEHSLARQIDLLFQVTLVEEGLRESFWERISRGVVGSFSGIDEGEHVLNQAIRSVDWSDADRVVTFLDQVEDMLHVDHREGRGQRTAVAAQLRRGFDATGLYDLLWGLAYVRPHYQLQLRGHPLPQLSPGQKGTLLLVFYLLVDKADVPLVIDQPEENLDNETVTRLLVPALKEARARRQLVLVTHNPNIAVVGDADQIVYAQFEDAEITYVTGAMEHPDMNRRLTDVLEGTLRAFKNRRDKYVWELELAEVAAL